MNQVELAMSDFWTRRMSAPRMSLWIAFAVVSTGCQGAGFLGLGPKKSSQDKNTTISPRESDQAGARGADKGGAANSPTTGAQGVPGGENFSPGQQPVPGSEGALPYPIPNNPNNPNNPNFPGSGPGSEGLPGNPGQISGSGQGGGNSNFPGQYPNGVSGSGGGNGSSYFPGSNVPGTNVGGGGSGGGTGVIPGSGTGYGPGNPNEGFPPGTQVPPGTSGWTGSGSGTGGGLIPPGTTPRPIGSNPNEGFPNPIPPIPPIGSGQYGGGTGSYGQPPINWGGGGTGSYGLPPYNGGGGSGTSGCIIPNVGCGPNEDFPGNPPIVVVPPVIPPINPPIWPIFWEPLPRPPVFYPPPPPVVSQPPQPPYPAPKGKTWLELTVVQTDHESWWKNCLWVAVEDNQPWKAIACNKDKSANGRTVFLLADEYPACNKVQVFVETYHNQGNICNIRAQQGLPCEGPYAPDGKIDYSRNPFFAHEAVFFRAYDRIGIKSPDPLIRPNVNWVLGDTNALSQAMGDFRGPDGRNKWLRIFFEDQPRGNLDKVVAAPAQWKKYGVDFNDYVFDVKGRNVKFNIEGSGLTCESK